MVGVCGGFWWGLEAMAEFDELKQQLPVAV